MDTPPSPSDGRPHEIYRWDVDVFEHVQAEGHEQVVFCHHAATGLRAVVAIHSTALGPGLGGTRFYPYASEAQAVEDVLRLSKGMTYKNAAAGLDCGGGKAVIIGSPATDRTEALIRAYGRFIHSLGGRYMTAEDVGTTQDDMDLIRRETPYVTGVSEWQGGSGDPSPATAWGVLHAMGAAWGHHTGADRGVDGLAGLRVVVVGVGKVGGALAGHLIDQGAHVAIADVDAARVARLVEEHAGGPGTITAVELADAHRTPADILSPCALGAGLNAATIPEIGAAIVCGAANNQLATDDDAERIAERGIVYAPDFVVNAGGVINIAEELGDAGYDRTRALRAVERIAGNVTTVLRTAAAEGITTTAAAEAVAERRIAAVSSVRLL